MKEYTPFKSGKVREVYDAGDSIIMVATDRISAFDHILKNKITKKRRHPHADVQVLVRYDVGHHPEPHDFRRQR